MKITRTEYDEYRAYQEAEANGLFIMPDTLRLICEAYDYDAQKVGEHFLSVLGEMRSKHPKVFKNFCVGHTPWREMRRELHLLRWGNNNEKEKEINGGAQK